MKVFLQSRSRKCFYNGGTVCPRKALWGPAQLEKAHPEGSAVIFFHLLSTQETGFKDFPGGPMVGTPSSSPGGPGWGAKIPPASWPQETKCRTEVML